MPPKKADNGLLIELPMSSKKVAVLEQTRQLTPFIKWAGGKRWLWRHYPDEFPIDYRRYFEPFLGGASIFLSLRPRNGVLSDLNEDLVNCYKAVKQDWQLVAAGLMRHQRLHCKEHYYRIRSKTPHNSTDKAVRFLYLNRTCWNGLYRVNLRGQFNVPKGTKNEVALASDDLEEASRRLKKMRLLVADFETALSSVLENDFVYIDPPYTVKHNVNGFLKYNENIFSWADQERLADCVLRLAKRGAKVLVSQADHDSIRRLYRGIGTQRIVERTSVIAASASKRGLVNELLIRVNY